MSTDALRYESFKYLTARCGGQSALARFLNAGRERKFLTQQNISSILASGRLSFITARYIERALYLPSSTMDFISLERLHDAGLNVLNLRCMENEAKDAIHGLVRLLLERSQK